MEIFPADKGPTVHLEEEHFYFTLVQGNIPALFACSIDSAVIGAVSDIQCLNFCDPLWDFIAFMSSWLRATGSPALIAEKHSEVQKKLCSGENLFVA